MTPLLWYTLVGGLLIAVALLGTLLRRLPITATILYFAVGVAMSPWGLGMIRLDPVAHPDLLERLTELVVLISLFTAGLKLRLPLSDGHWGVPIRLASVSMVVTVGLIALAAWYGLGLSLGGAVLLGAVLAPTDPVLAGDVQVEHAGDDDRLRFGLTGEAGLNDGTAFPFVMLGLGLLGLHDLGEWGWMWWTVDLLWATVAGLAVGTLCGWLVAKLVLYLRKVHREAVGTDDFLALGLIGLSYGLAHHVGAYGFLAVFAAGLALRRVERRSADSPERPPKEVADSTLAKPPEEADRPGDAADPPETKEDAVDLPDPSGRPALSAQHRAATAPETAPRVMASAILGFNEQLERIGQVLLVVLVGGVLPVVPPVAELLWFVPLLFFVIRPAAVGIGLIGAGLPWVPQTLAAWFGIRGIGSLYYLAYAISHGIEEDNARLLMTFVLWTVAASLVVHGLSVNVLMDWYRRRPDDAPGG